MRGLPVRRPREQQDGFTLLEMLVCALLMALLAVGIAATVRIALVLPRYAGGQRQLQPMLAAQGFLRQTLSQALALPSADWAGVAFLGEPQAMEWIGLMPEHAGAAGLSEISLRFERPRVMLRWRLLTEPLPHERAIFDHIQKAHFFYWAEAHAPGAASGWQEHWPHAHHLPRLVRLQIQSASAELSWPDLVIALPVGLDQEDTP